MTDWLMRHKRTVTLLHRFVLHPLHLCRCGRVWADLLKDPQFVASLERGQADMAAGRWYRWNGDGTTTPNPDWPKDGPQPS